MSFGKRVRQIRRAKNLTLKDLAKMTGLNYVTISRIETQPNDEGVWLGSARRIAIALDCSIDELAGRDKINTCRN